MIDSGAILTALTPVFMQVGLLVGAIMGARYSLIAIILVFKLVRKDYRPMPMWLVKDKKAWSDYRKRHK